MGSFSKMSVWPTGYFRAYSSWLLRNRREISTRIEVINAEIGRIGDVVVLYRGVDQPDGSVLCTEERVGIRVTPGSSLGKLFQAYIAMGGNPYDISPFMKPDSTEVLSVDGDGKAVIREHYPHGGVAAPISAGPNEPTTENGASGFGAHPGGYIRMDSYYPARQGGRVSPGAYDHDGIVRDMHHLREWAKQDIDERIRRIEWQIIKLCDLREQLTKERDEVLVQAFGGALEGIPPFEPSRFNSSFRVQNIVQEMSSLIFATSANGPTFAPSDLVKDGNLRFTFPDTASEANRFLLGC
jgi:hypothetical protein